MKQNLNCDACGKPYRDFAPEGSQTCECHKKLLRALRDDYMNDHSVRSPSTDGESAICASSLNKPSSQEGLKPVAWRFRDNDMGPDDWYFSEFDPAPDTWDVVEPLYTRHPSFNDAMSAEQREIAAKMLAAKMLTTEWADLKPFTRAKYRTAILTMESIIAAAVRAHSDGRVQA